MISAETGAPTYTVIGLNSSRILCRRQAAGGHAEDPIDTLASMLRARHGLAGAFDTGNWRSDSGLLRQILEKVSLQCVGISNYMEGILPCLSDGSCCLLRYEDLLRSALPELQRICSFLAISPTAEEIIQMISSDRRQAASTRKAVEALQSCFCDYPDVAKVLSIYSLNYAVSPKGQVKMPESDL